MTWCGASASCGCGADIAARLLFLDCDSETLLRRYTESRRPHPLAPDRPVKDGIGEERKQLGWVRDSADLVIDTSALSPHAFKQLLVGHFALGRSLDTRIAVMSFSYRRGLPREADLVFDVRFLKNPHYDPVLKPLTGRNPAVAGFVASDPGYQPFIGSLEGPDRAAAAAIRRGGQELFDHRHRLHRRPAPLGGGGRGAGRVVARRGPLGHSLAPGRRCSRGGWRCRVEHTNDWHRTGDPRQSGA